MAILFSLGVMASVLLTGCSEEPEDLIPEDDYINLLVEFELINAFNSDTGNTDTVLRAIDQIFVAYGVTEEQFLRSHEFYQRDVENQVSRHRTAVERVSQVHSELTNQLNEQLRSREQEE
ncbi:MAG: DUF4296 domain-containing protein [Balneolia bacterium]|nr:DUF4296 domain-containing protein [Balneolia bacterium]